MIKPLKHINIRIPDKLQRELRMISKRENVSVSDLVRESIQQYVAVKKFRKLRSKILPLAEAQGLVTDEDIFKAVS